MADTKPVADDTPPATEEVAITPAPEEGAAEEAEAEVDDNALMDESEAVVEGERQVSPAQRNSVPEGGNPYVSRPDRVGG